MFCLDGMSIQHREYHRTRPRSRGSRHIETIVRVHPRRDVDTRLFRDGEKDSFASDRTEGIEMGAAIIRHKLLQLKNERLVFYLMY